MLQIMDKWTEYLVYGGQIDVIYFYCDSEKAFEKVPHKRLTSKLVLCGFNSTGTFINWIKIFLKRKV